MAEIGQIAQFKPETLQKINQDELVNRLADMRRIDARILNSDEDVALMRQQAQQAQEMAQGLQMAQMGADVAQKGAEVKKMGAEEQMMKEAK